MVSRRNTAKRSQKGSRNGSRKQRGGKLTSNEKNELLKKLDELNTYADSLSYDSRYDNDFDLFRKRVNDLHTHFLSKLLDKVSNTPIQSSRTRWWGKL